MRARLFGLAGFLFGALLLVSALVSAAGGSASPYAGTQVIKTPHAFDALVARLERAISENRMGLVAQASASRGAATRGVKIPGNAVLMVFRNDFAIRMLAASVPAGIE
ncbi:MAG: DUF302 domain-containing protein, partial [Acidiferrobacterales bacterium]|nr:DUF302 domain-containing protein [Acidiferrobacterales bacterium]